MKMVTVQPKAVELLMVDVEQPSEGHTLECETLQQRSMALRLRRSAFMRGFIEQKTKEDREIQAALNATIKHQETRPLPTEAQES